MNESDRDGRVHPAWWSLALLLAGVVLVTITVMLCTGAATSTVPVTLTSDRSGLVMEPGSKVKMRGVEVGRVESVIGGDTVALRLDMDPGQLEYIPANVTAEIKATTAFGAKYVDIVVPDKPSSARLKAGAVLKSTNVSTEVNTVFQNLVDVLKAVEPQKLNAVLTTLSQGFRGQGDNIGNAISAANHVLSQVNPRMDTVGRDFRSLEAFSDTYNAVAPDVLEILANATVTSSTVVTQQQALDSLLVNLIGFANAGTDLLAPAQGDIVRAINVLEPTTDLLLKYNPEYTCLVLGAKWFLDNGGYEVTGGNGSSALLDAGILFGDDMYRYPEHLPIVAAKGGPGGKPGCGSLPDASKNYPVRQLVMNTGWGTGLDVRPNPGIAHPFYLNYFPTTRAVPEEPSVRGEGPPAIGPVPYPGAPPYGAPLYGPGGVPLWPGVPPAPPNPVPAPPGPVPTEGSQP